MAKNNFAAVDPSEKEIHWCESLGEAERQASNMVREGSNVVFVFEMKAKVSRSVKVEVAGTET